jgi:hypothetical protein
LYGSQKLVWLRVKAGQCPGIRINLTAELRAAPTMLLNNILKQSFFSLAFSSYGKGAVGKI